jgi:hypothetical protein
VQDDVGGLYVVISYVYVWDVSTLSTVTKASNQKGQEKRRKNIESKHVSIRCIGVCVRSWIIIRTVLIVTFAFRKMQQKKLPTKKAM